MAKAGFDIEVHSASGRPEIQAGDRVKVRVSAWPESSHNSASLDWSVGWIARGRSDDLIEVASGSEPLGRIGSGEEITREVSFDVPNGGPVSYHGRLLSVEWFFKVSLDIAWAFDPKSEWAFEVVPR